MLSIITKRTLFLTPAIASFAQKYPIIGDESMMRPRSHGSCDEPVQHDLRWEVDYTTADRICCYNRHYAEHAGYSFHPKVTWIKDLTSRPGEITNYYDSVTGKSLFKAPVGRTLGQFITESDDHGWPSFRDEEVDWENVRCL